MLLNLQSTIIYGPIQSRRIGSSLGINILPADVKVCTFDCLYCQYGWTDFSTMENADFPKPPAVAEALKKSLGSLPALPRYITFSGNGEPTLHPAFGEIVDDVIRIRNEYAPDSHTAILSNSSTVHCPEIRGALSKLDLRIMKLDAGDPDMFGSYNRPAQGMSIGQMMEGLVALDDVTIQSLFTKGPSGNFSEPNLTDWVARLRAITPRLVQLYTLDRGYPSRAIEVLERDELDSIQARLEGEGIPAETF